MDVSIAGSGDVEFIAASPAFTVQAYDWKRANLVIPAATKNLFTTTSQSVHLRHALFSHVRTGMEQVRVDVQATSPGFSGTLTVSAWFDISS